MDGQEKPDKPTNPSPDSSQEDLPGAKNRAAASTSTSTPIPSPRHAFPPVMNAYGQWTKLKAFNLCGATEKDRLYQVSLHTGYSASAPLGTRPGVLLHNGMSSKDPVLAAAGYDSQASFYSFNNQSVVLMPPLPGAAMVGDFVTEQMPAVVRGDLLVFSFSIEVGSGGGTKREKFEWRKFKSGVDGNNKEGGFRLVRLPSSGSTKLGQEKDTAASSSPAGADDNGEVVGCLAWRKLFPTFKHAFTLELLGRGQSGELGERWSLMVVITALRLWALRANRKTSKSAIAGGQKVTGN